MQFGTYRVICKLQRFIFCLRLYVFSMHSLRVPTVFILFVTASVSPMMSTFLHAQRFLFCLSPYLFSEWHIVPQLCIQIKQSRVHSRKALAGCKASRRLGKQIRGLSRFLSKFHPIAVFCYPTPTDH